ARGPGARRHARLSRVLRTNRRGTDFGPNRLQSRLAERKLCPPVRYRSQRIPASDGATHRRGARRGRTRGAGSGGVRTTAARSPARHAGTDGATAGPLPLARVVRRGIPGMTTKTVRMKASQITKDWHVIDAADRPLGRVATEVATLLRGKHKPNFEPHLDMGDFVIVINASKVRLSGGKSAQKKYY